MLSHGIIYYKSAVYRVGASQFKRGEVMRMDTYQILSVLFLAGTFLIALLTYIDRHFKK